MFQIVSSMLTVIGRAELSELPKHVLESLHTCIVDKGYENMCSAETELGILILEVRKCLCLHTTARSCIGDAESVDEESVETDDDEDMPNTSSNDADEESFFFDANEMYVSEDIGVCGEEETGHETNGSNDPSKCPAFF
mmetsp:Transcript_18431/g.27727  ORF Transcript_18431/g.27727 Transcript_18431/m.27727 type:complete len:139 (+) Transcript_18431:406-822(+)